LIERIAAGSDNDLRSVSDAVWATRCAGWRESAVNARMRNPIFYQADEP
jgi:hypothetical protein